MAFDESPFPVTESYRSLGGPGFQTTLVQTDAGTDEASSSWSSPLKRYDLRIDLRDDATIGTVVDWYNSHRGSLIGFRFDDLSDHASTADGKTLSDSPAGAADPSDTDQLLGTGDGTETVFQLVKNYGGGAYITKWPVTKVKTGTVVVSIDDVSQATGWTVNHDTGKITFDTAPGSGLAVKAGFEYHVPVRIGPEVDRWLVVEKSTFTDGQITTLPLVEIRSAPAYYEQHIMRGAFDHGSVSSVNIAITFGLGLYQVFDPTDASVKLLLPNEDDMPSPGHGYWKFENKNGTNALTVADEGGTALFGGSSIPANSFGEVVLVLDSGGNRIWRLIS